MFSIICVWTTAFKASIQPFNSCFWQSRVQITIIKPFLCLNSIFPIRKVCFINTRNSVFFHCPHHNRASSMLYSCGDSGGCSSFINSSRHINTSIWPKDFELWFVSPKDFIPLSSLCVPGPTEAFWYCFVSTTVVSWHQFCHIGQLHRFFSSQKTFVQLCSDI